MTDSTKRQTTSKDQRFGRVAVLLFVLGGVVVSGIVFNLALGLDVFNGQLGVALVAVTVALFLLAQLVRFRFKVSLRAMMMLVAALAAIFAYVGRDLLESRREAVAVRELVKGGARVDYGRSPTPTGAETLLTENGWRVPSWLVDMLGESYFSGLRNVRFLESDIEDKDITILTEVRNLEWIDFRNSKVTARGLAHLPDVPGLNYVSLNWDQLSPESAARLSQLPDLRKLVVTYQDPQSLAITGKALTMANVDLLAGLNQVEHLSIELQAADGRSMSAIAGLPNLTVLNLHTLRTVASGPPDLTGLHDLANSPSLQSLTVMAYTIKEDEVAALIRIPTLEYLYFMGLWAGQPTDDALNAFRQARPDVLLEIN